MVHTSEIPRTCTNFVYQTRPTSTINLYFRYTPQLNFSAIPVGPDTDWAYWFNSVPKGAKTGKDNGFSVLFDIESYDYGYYDEGSEGLKVAIVHHLDMPIIRQRAFHVAPGTENQIPVTPTLYTTNPQVSNICGVREKFHEGFLFHLEE